MKQNSQSSMTPIKPSSPVEVFYNENYLDKFQDREFKEQS